MMKCENLQLNLPVYLDDVLTGEERAAIENHLVQCPMCRQKAAEFQSLRTNLRALTRPEISSDLLVSLRNRAALEAKTPEAQSKSIFTESFQRWLLMRLMPVGVGTVVSMSLMFGLLWLLLIDNKFAAGNEIARLQSLSRSTILLANAAPKINSGDSEAVLPNLEVPSMVISGESPSINPQGALIALTKSFVRGKMKDDEVVVVAEIFGNGLARIDEVVEPSRDRQAVRELQNALDTDPNYEPPFVPAHLDQRSSNTVRVVLKIQSVNINTHLKRK